MSKKIAIVDGNFAKDIDQEWKKDNIFVGGELQKRIEKFGESHNILDVKPMDSRTYMIIYE